MTRRVLTAAAAALAALAIAAPASSATLGFVSLDETEVETPTGIQIQGSLVNTTAQVRRPAGSTVGSYRADLRFVSESLATVTAVFSYPGGRLVVVGSFDPSAGPVELHARGFGSFRGAGTLSVGDGDGTEGGTEFIFRLS